MESTSCPPISANFLPRREIGVTSKVPVSVDFGPMEMRGVVDPTEGPASFVTVHDEEAGERRLASLIEDDFYLTITTLTYAKRQTIGQMCPPYSWW
jgi:hypothetical protein